MSISVNGITITEQQIGLEAQYHPASDWETARHQAAHALVVRQLLLEEAQRTGLAALDAVSEREGHDAIRDLMDQRVPVPELELAECLAYYRENVHKFRGPVLFDPSHILFASHANDPERESVRQRAQMTLLELKRKPSAFEAIARNVSACPSATNGGRLGQTTEGETVPEFEAVLRRLSPGELFSELVETKHGFHIVRLEHRAEASVLPFEIVKDKILIYLRDRAWRKQVRSFVASLAAGAQIEGFDLYAAAPARSAPTAPVATEKPIRRLRVLN